MTADVISDAAAFERLAAEWDRVLDESGRSTPFLKYAWVDCWRRYAHDGGTLNIIAVRERGRLAAVMPLMRVRRPFSLVDRLEFMGRGPAGADYLDVILRRGGDSGAIDAIAGALDAQQLSLVLDHLPPSSYAAQVAVALGRDGWTTVENSPDVCPFIDLSAHTWPSYLQTLGSAHRANVRRRLRAMDSQFDMQFALAETHHDRRDALDALVGYSEQRWQNRGGSSAFPSPEMIAFHHHVTRRAMDEGWLRLYTLRLDGAVAAVMYGFVIDNRFYFYQHGYDDAYSHYSAGLVVMALSIRAAIEEGVDEFDMLYGHESYKSLWAREQRPLTRLHVFPPRIAGTLLRTQVETRRTLRLIVDQLGLRPRA
jgi:CelD/BcsL family acetyltransferase involved in cellulose biosynthesis